MYFLRGHRNDFSRGVKDSEIFIQSKEIVWQVWKFKNFEAEENTFTIGKITRIQYRSNIIINKLGRIGKVSL